MVLNSHNYWELLPGSNINNVYSLIAYNIKYVIPAYSITVYLIGNSKIPLFTKQYDTYTKFKS